MIEEASYLQFPWETRVNCMYLFLQAFYLNIKVRIAFSCFRVEGNVHKITGNKVLEKVLGIFWQDIILSLLLFFL